MNITKARLRVVKDLFGVVKALYSGYKWMVGFGLRQAFLQEQQLKNRLEELLRLKDDYFCLKKIFLSKNSWARYSLQTCIFVKLVSSHPIERGACADLAEKQGVRK